MSTWQNSKSDGERLSAVNYYNPLLKRLGSVDDVGSFKGSPASFIVFKSGSVYYAMNGTTGDVDYSGADAATVIQAALTSGGTIFIKKADYGGASVTVGTNSYLIIEKGVTNLTYIITGSGGVDGSGCVEDQNKSSLDMPTPWLASTFNCNYMNSSYLAISLSPMSYVHDMIYDKVYDCVFGCTRADANINYVFKIKNGVLTSKALGGSGDNRAMCLLMALDYLWASCLTTPARLLKIDPSTLNIVETYTMNSGENQGTALAFDGTYIYMSLNVNGASGGKMIRFDPVSETHTIYELTGTFGLYWSLFDGTYVWVTGTISVDTADIGSIGKFNVATQVFTSYALTGTAGTGEMTYDGYYVWAINQNSKTVTRFDPNNVTQFRILKFLAIDRIIEFGNGYIWLFAGEASGSTSILTRIDPLTLNIEKTIYVVAGYKHGFCWDGLNLWFSFWIASPNVYRVPAYNGGSGGTSLVMLDGKGEAIDSTHKYDSPLWIDTDGLETNQAVTKIPVSSSYKGVRVAITILTNTLDSLLAVGLYNGSTLINLVLQIEAGLTGIFFVEASDWILTLGDTISVKLWAGVLCSTGSATIGKTTISIQG